MKKIFAVTVLIAMLTACSNGAAQLYETAKFEELQNNKDHAAKLYREIIEKYPASPQAKEAAKRLAELQGMPGDIRK